jgi:L-ascorbate metabolism protein UlaG (beta-lactamase superfamily)
MLQTPADLSSVLAFAPFVWALRMSVLVMRIPRHIPLPFARLPLIVAPPDGGLAALSVGSLRRRLRPRRPIGKPGSGRYPAPDRQREREMKYTWLGHSAVRLEIADQVLLIDPWEDGNPLFPADRRDEANAGVTAILITHGHFDHTGGVPALARELNVPVYGIYDLMAWWGEAEGIETVGFNKGGTVQIGEVAVTMVNAAHSSSMGGEAGPVYAGGEAGYMIAGEGRTVYVSGDTDVMADMTVLQDLHTPEIGILCAGGHFTMDMKRAAYAASRLFSFKTVIPYHYKTFPMLAQDAGELKSALPGVRVLDPDVMETIAL